MVDLDRLEAALADRYRIERAVGSGGMATVYLAEDLKHHRKVAVKVLDPDLAQTLGAERFLREIKTAASLTHPHILPLHDSGESDGFLFYVMPFVKGKSLRTRLGQEIQLPVEDAIHITREVADALAYAHREGIIHRDVKPANIMLEEGHAVLADFGVAQAVAEAKDERLTQAGTSLGTPAYMSPEQAAGEGELDGRTDQYALGCVLYEMLTGQAPFPGDTPLGVAVRQITEEPADPRGFNGDISEDLSRLILKCLDKNREARFENVQELFTELGDLSEGRPLTAHVEGVRSPPFFEEDAVGFEGERPVFVARDEELSRLEELLGAALSGKGQVAFVRGEAGSGKTALIQEFAWRAQAAHPDLIVASGNCNAHTGVGDPYLPFREILALLTGEVEGRWKAGSIGTDHARRLWRCVPLMAQTLVEEGPELISTLVEGQGLIHRVKAATADRVEWVRKLRGLVETKTALPSDPNLQQSVLLRQCCRVLLSLADSRPALLMLDDLQWVDTGSANLLRELAEGIQDSCVLVVGAYRPEEVALDRNGERHPLKPIINECKARFGDIELEVGQTGGREFVNAFLDTEPNRFGSSFRESFLKHTEGHSLFTTEVFRGLKEQGAVVQDADGRWRETEIDWGRLPTRVEAIIGERIERIPEYLRETLRGACIEGEYFTGEVVARVTNSDEREMVRWLSGELNKRYRLVSAQGIQLVGGQRRSQYRFRHILFQKYLYSSLDRVERAHLHEEVGTALEERYGERSEEISVQLARHFREAGMAEKAIQYLQKAGARAVAQSANVEAAAHFGEALELLKRLPASPERVGEELSLQTPLAVALMNLRGYAEPEVGKAFGRAHSLCKEIGETPQIVPVLYGLLSFYFVRAEYEKELEIVDELFRIAPGTEDPSAPRLMGHFSTAGYATMTGDPTEALRQANKALSLYEPSNHRFLTHQVGQDHKGASLCWAFLSQWLLGYPDQAGQTLEQAITFTRNLGHPFTLSFTLAFASQLHQFRRDAHALQETAEEELAFSTEHGFLGWMGWVLAFQGWAQVGQGQAEEGMEQLRQGLAVKRASGARIFDSNILAMLAEACMGAGQLEDSLAVLEEGLAFVEETGERFYEAELHRLRGELGLLRCEDEKEVEEHYRRAIHVARGQMAKSLELRATRSLARLWQRQGRREEARDRLSEICCWFTEGFDTRDLKDAGALLEELS